MAYYDDYRRFGDIPDRTVFADKYGRVHTKQSAGVAAEHAAGHDDDGWPIPKIDTTREYFEIDEDEDDDPSVFDAWPYYALPNEQPVPDRG